MRYILLLINFLIANFANAYDLPQELLYKNQPIDPICLEFRGDSSHFDVLPLANCHLKSKTLSGFQIINKNPPEGFVGYEYTYDDAFNISYSYYKYLGKIDNLLVILVETAGGGTGRFSNIKFLERKNDTIHFVKNGPGGDRATGIKSAKVIDNTLIYSIGLTSLDIISLVGLGFKESKYGVEFCAICQKAIAHFKNDQLEYVEFAKEYADLNANPNAPNQECFNKVYNDYVKANKVKLNEKELKKFVARFKKQCLK